MLHEFVTRNRHEIIARYHEKVQARVPRLANAVEIDHGVPRFLAQLVHELRPGLSSCSEMATLATTEAHDLLWQGFTISELVHHYGDVGQVITDLAIEARVRINIDDSGVLDRCVDDAIAAALSEHRRSGQSPNTTLAGPTESHPIASMVRDLRESMNTARVALRAVKSGRVGLAGSTGAVLDWHLLDATISSNAYWSWWTPSSMRGLIDVDAQFQQFAADSWSAPEWVRVRHRPNQRADVGRLKSSSMAALPSDLLMSRGMATGRARTR